MMTPAGRDVRSSFPGDVVAAIGASQAGGEGGGEAGTEDAAKAHTRDSLQARDPLFLQTKEATASVLEAYLRKSRYKQHGERVVQGQRMMQAASGIYLGWTKGLDVRRRFYGRQLRNVKARSVPRR
jgi:hypothetical protein